MNGSEAVGISNNLTALAIKSMQASIDNKIIFKKTLASITLRVSF